MSLIVQISVFMTLVRIVAGGSAMATEGQELLTKKPGRDLAKVISIRIVPEKASFRTDEPIRFALEIRNKTMVEQEVICLRQGASSSAFTRAYYFVVRKEGKSAPVYVQPNVDYRPMSEIVSSKTKTISLAGGETYLEEYSVSPQQLRFGWLDRLFRRDCGTFSIEIDLNLASTYRRTTPDFDKINRVTAQFERFRHKQ